MGYESRSEETAEVDTGLRVNGARRPGLSEVRDNPSNSAELAEEVPSRGNVRLGESKPEAAAITQPEGIRET